MKYAYFYLLVNVVDAAFLFRNASSLALDDRAKLVAGCTLSKQIQNRSKVFFRNDLFKANQNLICKYRKIK
jgi:hypothetical protein